ncbi:hypothetical protein LCGC14_1138050 [marine sediment metagenome]|uniref:dUTP diphosphatase n=1 Tax=marine sediment metagenome TaxID=412755 RepID=A0A0F9MM34_9ZZZZ
MDFCRHSCVQRSEKLETVYNIGIKIINKNFITPKQQTCLSAGVDIHYCSEEPITLKSLERTLVPTGFCMELPPGIEAQIRPRSGLAIEHGITVLNSPGTIDADFTSEIKVILINLSNESFTITPGMRIAQMVVAKHAFFSFTIKEKLNDTDRGTGSFGSTGL